MSDKPIETYTKSFPCYISDCAKCDGSIGDSTDSFCDCDCHTEINTDQENLLKHSKVKTIISAMPEIQKVVMVFMTKKENKDRWFTQKEVAQGLGFPNDQIIRKNFVFPALVQKGFVKRKKEKFQQNFSVFVKLI